MPFNARINKTVFLGASAILAALVLFATIYPDSAAQSFSAIQQTVVDVAGWFYIVVVAAVLISLFCFSFSSFGDIKLGPEHSTPDYSYLTWFSMLFSAGIGIGLLFFGVAEPVMHYIQPPKGDPATIDAAREAMNLTFFHWGLHGWALYALVGLALAYYGYRLDLPLTLRSSLYPLIGDRIYSLPGHALDIFAIVGTTLGVATSLGLGVAQINAGLSFLTGLEESQSVQIWLVVGVMGLAMISVLSGLDKGIRRLSEVNMILAVALLILVLLAGPTIFLIQKYIQNTGAYFSELVDKTFNLYAYEPTSWFGGWTIFYWAWWISWSPFVGMFIARISRGRTIREFILGVLFIPSGFIFLWMTVFGNSAIDIINSQGMELANAVTENNAIALFRFLENFPLTDVLSGITIIMIVIFFVTSADSGALVLNMLASGGEEDTPVWQKVYWVSAIGLVAVLLMFAGGLGALQTATIISALPFAVVILFILYALFSTLKLETAKKDSLLNSMITTPSRHTASEQDNWKQRISMLAIHPPADTVKAFIQTTGKSALENISQEMEKNGYETDVEIKENSVALQVYHKNEVDFFYLIKLKGHQLPEFATENDETDDSDYYRAEIYLNEGSQQYCVMGYSEGQIIKDVLDQYEKHRHFLHIIR